MDNFFTTYLIYPDTEPIKFLLTMLLVIAYGLYVGVKEDK